MQKPIDRPVAASRAAAVLAFAVLGLLASRSLAAPQAAAANATGAAAAATATATAPAAGATAGRPAKLAAAGADPLIARGRYLVQVAGCNDCHTPNYPETGGKVPEQDWLVGLHAVGWQGPWGTTYSSNLRKRFAELTEEQWMATARAPRRPPMPWFALRDMEDQDLRAIYRYVRSLGAKGEHVPAAVAPGGEVRTPVIVFAPTLPAAPQASAKPAPGARTASR
jgi:mono/diheme cytochrome c family protein